ncbi:uncharacterized protein Tco025E_05338 [Trypanosoma conorhini]|uniref:Uncharacterized protein n=1 Tax=Trypanosoma conorhini TaxID=83891 RepID=A0A3R7NB57_9TRYP|nr:uncharacterized protein Tco025E_05338 [Trypanosoma conorhini]RNF15949.1 hypothetical protein Tco025E_05338 [Trypanosoma conorhini]
MRRGPHVGSRLCSGVKLWVAAHAQKHLCASTSSSGEEAAAAAAACGKGTRSQGGGCHGNREGAAGSSSNGTGWKTTAATADERRRIAKGWENAFFGRVHYEPGMHEKYQAAVEMEGEETGLMRKDNRDLFPHWPEDEEAPLHEFRRLPDALKRRYIVNRLTMGERRITYAADYGGLLMMQHLNLGEMMINEAERLIVECGWCNDAVAAKIEAVRECAARTKFEFDLD